MTSLGRKPSTTTRTRARWAAFGLFLALLAFGLVACGTAFAANASPTAPVIAAASASAGSATAASATSPSPSHATEPQPLKPTSPGADQASLVGFLFTPIFQGPFVLLAEIYALTGNIVVAIVLMTLIIRLVTIRLTARQITSQKRMQILAPKLRELTKELNRRYKGDPMAIQKATQAFYKEYGVSPTAGCLPSLLQLGLVIPMWRVIQDGLTNYDPSAMLKVFGVDLVPSIQCPHVVLASSTGPRRASTPSCSASTSGSRRSSSICRWWYSHSASVP